MFCWIAKHLVKMEWDEDAIASADDLLNEMVQGLPEVGEHGPEYVIHTKKSDQGPGEHMKEGNR